MKYEREICHFLCKIFLFLLYLHLILIFVFVYKYEQTNTNKYLLTTCQINQTQLRTSFCRTKLLQSSKIDLCSQIHYKINYRSNLSLFMDSIPTWISSYQLDNLISNSTRFPCYFNQMNLSDIRWFQPNSQRTLFLLLIYSFSFFLLIVYILNEIFHRRFR